MTFTTIVPIAMELRQWWDRRPARQPSLLTMHLTPGRLRLRMPERRGDETFARQAEHAIAPIPGVTQVCANPVTGSVLVRFDPRRLDAQQILIELEYQGLLGRRCPCLPAPAPPISEVATRIGTAVGKELAKAALAEVLGQAWLSPLLALL